MFITCTLVSASFYIPWCYHFIICTLIHVGNQGLLNSCSIVEHENVICSYHIPLTFHTSTTIFPCSFLCHWFNSWFLTPVLLHGKQLLASTICFSLLIQIRNQTSSLEPPSSRCVLFAVRFATLSKEALTFQINLTCLQKETQW